MPEARQITKDCLSEGFPAGGTLDVEENGGIVTLEDFPRYDSFIRIGTLTGKKSSGSN